jgi:hypothetical protein
MKTQLVFRFAGLLILAVILVGADAPLQARREIPTTPEGLGHSDWSGIRGAFEKHRHAVVANSDGTFQARNPGQAWLTKFDGHGFTVTPDSGGWSWGLELVGSGGSDIPPAAHVTTEGNRISFRRDGAIEEWFLNDARGLEQGWTILSKTASDNPTLSQPFAVL